MKKNAILFGAIAFVAAGCAHQSGYDRASMDSGMDMEPPLHATSETPDRNPDGSIRNPSWLASDDDHDAMTTSTVRPYDSSLNAGAGTPAEMRDGISVDPGMDVEMGIGAAAGSQIGRGSSSRRSNLGDLNSSDQLEENISGEFNLPENSSRSSAQRSDSGAKVVPQVGVTGDEPEWLFENNRAQGVGSAATGEFGVATSRDPLNQIPAATDRLAEQVKARLVEESTGTHGLMSHQVARNIQVESHNGIVTLKGSVPSEQDRKLVEIRAAEIAGVVRVNNQLIVTPDATPERRDRHGHDLEDSTNELQR